MKKLQCEMCGNTELEKRGDSYVCSVCGTEYVEEENNDNDDKIETIIFDFTASEKECLLSIKEWLIASDYVPDDILAKAKFEPMGDVYADGVVNSKDAVKLSQYLAKWDVGLTDTEKKSADIVSDGYINSKDSIKLTQYLAKWNVTLD